MLENHKNHFCLSLLTLALQQADFVSGIEILKAKSHSLQYYGRVTKTLDLGGINKFQKAYIVLENQIVIMVCHYCFIFSFFSFLILQRNI